MIYTRQRAFVSIVLAVTLFAVFCTSCAVRPPARIAGGKAPCSAKTIDLLKKGVPEVRSVKATIDAYLTAEEPRRSERLQVGLAAQRPDKVRLNIYAGFLNLLNIAVDGDSIWAFLPSTSILLAGSTDEAAGQTLLPAPTVLILDAIRSLLFPDSFCITECKSEEIEKGRCRFEEYSEGGKRIGIVESRTGRLLSLDFVGEDGTERVKVNYGNYKKSAGTFFPQEITVLLPSDGVRLRLVFNRVVLNRVIDERVFRFKDIPSTSVRRFGDTLE